MKITSKKVDILAFIIFLTFIFTPMFISEIRTSKYLKEVNIVISGEENNAKTKVLETDEVIMEVIDDEIVFKPRHGGLELAIKEKPIKSKNIEELKDIIKKQNISARTSKHMILILEDKESHFDLKKIVTDTLVREDKENKQKITVFRANKIYKISKQEIMIIKDGLEKIESDFKSHYIISLLLCPIICISLLFKISPNYGKKEDDEDDDEKKSE